MDTLFLIIPSLSAVISLTVLIFLIRNTRAKEKEDFLIQNFIKDTVFFKTFQRELENLIKEETKKIISENKERVREATEESIKPYKEQIGFFAESIKEEVSQLNKISLENQEKILKATENEIAEFQMVNSDVRKILTEGVESKLDELSENVAKKVSEILQSVKNNLNQKMAESEKEIENYKQQKLKEIDQKIYQIIGEITKKITGKSIDLSTHEELVMEALEKAKKEIF